jgi:hypothetical protein
MWTDWLVGESKETIEIVEAQAVAEDDPPIFRLAEEIIRIAIEKHAEQIEFAWVQTDRFLETKRFLPSAQEEKWLRLLAEAGVKADLRAEEVCGSDRQLKATLGGSAYLLVPSGIAENLLRRYAFMFNYRACSDLAIPENLVKRAYEGKKASVSICNFDLKKDIAMLVYISYESTF